MLATQPPKQFADAAMFPASFHQTVSEVQQDFSSRHRRRLHHVTAHKLETPEHSRDDTAADSQHQRTRESTVEEEVQRRQPRIILADRRAGRDSLLLSMMPM
jgi:hypothetical protein